MIGDYFTKPLQVSLFRNFRNLTLGIEEAYVTEYKHMNVSNRGNMIIVLSPLLSRLVN